MKYRIIINGKFADNFQLRRILEMSRNRYDFDVRVTWSAGDVAEFIKETEGKYDRIIVAGGDGTMNEAIDGLVRLPSRPELAQIPLGTANDLAISGRVPIETSEAVNFAFSAKAFQADVTQLNNRYIINAASLGQAAKATHNTPDFLKGVVGKYAYSLSSLLSYFDTTNFIPFQSSNNPKEEYVFGYICNANSCGGGFMISEDAKIDDGLMDVLLIKKFALDNITNVTFDLWQNNDNEFIKRFTTDKFYLEAGQPLPVSIDGEIYSANKLMFQVLPKAVNLVISQESRLLTQNQMELMETN